MRHGFSAGLLSYNFSVMYFVNYLVAIGTGLSGDIFVDSVKMKPFMGSIYFGGLLMPFDVAIVCLLIGGSYVAMNWEDNYGETRNSFDQLKSFGTAAVMICTDLKMALCCGVIAFFESSMYIFVFNWTPVLKQGSAIPPFGMIFSTFMMACMIGASVFGLCDSKQTRKVLCVALGTAALAMLVPAYLGMSQELSKFNLWAFVAFEVCVGIYFPSICTLKSEAVPESHRATIYNFFRAPMNAIVVSVLLVNLDLIPTFKLISAMLLAAGILMAIATMLPETDSKLSSTLADCKAGTQ